MEKTEHGEIMVTLGVHTEMLTRIDGRLDTLNGKVAKHEEKLNDLALRNAGIDGERKGSKTIVMVIWTIFSAILGSVGVVLLTKYFQ